MKNKFLMSLVSLMVMLSIFFPSVTLASEKNKSLDEIPESDKDFSLIQPMYSPPTLLDPCGCGTSTTTNYTMYDGGEWSYTKMNTTYINSLGLTSTQYRNLKIVQKVVFYSPETVKLMHFELAKKLGINASLAPVKYGIETAAAGGIEYAKRKLTEKYGATKATAVIRYLSYVGWTYIAIDLLSSVIDGQQMARLNDAASKNKGLVYERARSVGDLSKWHYWDGSSQFGKYPFAKLGPNKYQIGSVKRY